MSTPQAYITASSKDQEKQEWTKSPEARQQEGPLQKTAFPRWRSRGRGKKSIAQLCTWVVDHQIGQYFNALPMMPYLPIHRHLCNPTHIAVLNPSFLPRRPPLHLQILPNLLLQFSHQQVRHRLGRPFIRVFLDHRLLRRPLRNNGLRPPTPCLLAGDSQEKGESTLRRTSVAHLVLRLHLDDGHVHHVQL